MHKTFLLNGAQETCSNHCTIRELVDQKGYSIHLIAVEYNQQVIPTNTLDQVIIQEDDRIEIVQFVGGG